MKRGRPLVKIIWVPDGTIIAGRPMHEWARHCLVELAGTGASLEELRALLRQNWDSWPPEAVLGNFDVARAIATERVDAVLRLRGVEGPHEDRAAATLRRMGDR